MHEVVTAPVDLARLESVIGAERTRRLLDVDVPRAQGVFGGRRLFNVNSTATGGGVAEMLHVIVGYTLGAGLDSRWLVIDAPPPFFELTKRLHNHLYGGPGDGGPLGVAERELYRRELAADSAALAARVRPGDLVILHDCQTAGLAAEVRRAGACVVWRCHVGVDEQNEWSAQGWAFLRPFIEPHVDGTVFSRRVFAPGWTPPARTATISPSIDPFAVKNAKLPAGAAAGILAQAGILAGPSEGARFTRPDGTVGWVGRRCEVVREGPAPTPGTPLVVQVSRWDPMKDMAGVMQAFVDTVLPASDAHLVLAGPAVAGVSDDPEAARVFAQCRAAWASLDPTTRRRVHLVVVPMDDADENAAIVNALQRHAAVVVQKSLAEGFGLTVTEAMYKGRPVVASAVGGIVDQIEDGANGFLVGRHDHDRLARRILELLGDAGLARRLGDAGHRTVVDRFLADSHLRTWLELSGSLLATRPSGP